jgi:hypothetical protein
MNQLAGALATHRPGSVEAGSAACRIKVADSPAAAGTAATCNRANILLLELAADVTVEEMVRVPGGGEGGDGRAAPGPYQARPGLALLPLERRKQ